MSGKSSAIGKGDRLILVDGSSFVFRAFFQSMNQDAKYNYRSDGLPTGALRMFCVKLWQFIREGAAGVKPTHLAIVLDKSEGSFRREIYPEYKGHRPDAPEDLKRQMPLMRDAVRAFGLIPVELERYEADDLIAAYAREAAAAGAEVVIVSADKDLMQLVGPHVRFYDFESGIKGKNGYRPERNLDVEGVIERWGVPPEKIADVLALTGDTSDNVPGVPGIGPKTAVQLLEQFGDLETLLERAGEIRQPKRRETLIENADKARLSRKLVLLDEKAPVPVPLADLTLAEIDAQKLIAFFKAMEFTTITKRVATEYDIDLNAVEADPELARGGDSAGESGAAGEVGLAEGDPQASPERLVKQRREEAQGLKIDREAYECLRDRDSLDKWIADAREAGIVALDTETDSLSAHSAELVGISLGLPDGRACYIPLQHRGGSDLFDETGLVKGQIPLDDALAALKPLLEEPGTLKIGHNFKYDWLVLARYGIETAPVDDTMLISYVLDAGRGGHGMDDLAERHLGHTTIKFAEVAGSGKKAVSFDRVGIEEATSYAAEDADVTMRLWRVLQPRLAAEAKMSVYQTLERPLVPVIACMERRGIKVDRQILSRLSSDFAQTLTRLEEEIQEDAGERFSVSSPRQIGEILFGKLGLPGGKKTPSGQWATPASALEELAEQGHPLPAKILEWRQQAKLKSTYSDALPNYMDEKGRVHTSFSLAATTTGRLSSSEPNLQNIPVRTPAGRKIRAAFVPEKGMKLISADYSQIELRILAHIADIPQLRKAFADGIDIHAATASEMFDIPLAEMTSEYRRRAKTINFGIIYGISAFGLANRLGIGREEAGAYIKQYFERFPGIRDYMEETKTYCREYGYVSTIFGRACHYPAIRAGNANERMAVERQAINAPIQGSAADIIRRAMIRMEDALSGSKLHAQMLLQVHDELIFEVPEDEVDQTIPLITRIMREAPHPALTLKVPLEVEARAADNWDEAH
ncbi:MAG: DNA polymerase I PolA [Saliniramus fredricksonii]|uniref:DNA polymerase I n=1 Tax=Saliniramus fredricksonii TaxID=1653334 RepID=A0A0P7XU70_9HYPH|nr:DNA polymerase I [Saliniramus fredricksonii]KPQ11086.1 MAG: DNA polymerase I PolA [Saliniramus fredricksonii]SCC78084.1 DNA polymerase I [Saliniramus fredricksonii]